MINYRLLVIFFFVILLFPGVFGADYREVQQITIPVCYGSIAFRIVGTTPVSPGDAIIGECPILLSCPCKLEEQSFYLSVLDNITNTFFITGEYYIKPWIEYDSTNVSVYNPNDDFKRYLRINEIFVSPGNSTFVKEKTGVPVDITKLMILVVGILVFVGLVGFIAFKLFTREKKVVGVNARSKMVKKKEFVRENVDDIQKYLRTLENDKK